MESGQFWPGSTCSTPRVIVRDVLVQNCPQVPLFGATVTTPSFGVEVPRVAYRVSCEGNSRCACRAGSVASPACQA